LKVNEQDTSFFIRNAERERQTDRKTDRQTRMADSKDFVSKQEQKNVFKESYRVIPKSPTQ
jgi:hypothetical protein